MQKSQLSNAQQCHSAARGKGKRAAIFQKHHALLSNGSAQGNPLLLLGGILFKA